jgi:anti-anti-sigma factor
MDTALARTRAGVFDIEFEGETAIVIPRGDLRELDYQQIEESGSEVLSLVARGAVRNVVMDFHKTDYFGSTALGFFVRLWRVARNRNGRMALCNVSEHEGDILRVTELGAVWPISSSRAEALTLVRGCASPASRP